LNTVGEGAQSGSVEGVDLHMGPSSESPSEPLE
jgi:hypothetical protein